MKTRFLRTKYTLVIAAAFLVGGAVIAYATAVKYDADHIGLWGGEADIWADTDLRTPAAPSPDTPFRGGWHYHPGFVYNVVTQGAVTVEDGCSRPDDPNPEDFGTRTYTVGQAFEKTDGRVHRAVNYGSIDEIEISMNIVPDGGRTRVATGGQRCGPARSVSECKAYWDRFDFPETFANQGACIAYVLSRPKVTLLVPEDPLL